MESINTVNASTELGKAEEALKNFKKANAMAKKKLGGDLYKTALHERIDTCQRVIAQSTMRPNPSTLSGSPNDPIPPGHTPGSGPEGSASGNGSRGEADSNAINSNPPKKPRMNPSAPRHRKILEEDPLELVKESINALMMSRFLAAWLEHGSAVEVADPTHFAEREPQFNVLCKAAVEIIDLVLNIAEQSNFTDEQLGWENDYDGGEVKISHLISLHTWLVTNELMVGNIQKKPAPVVKKAREEKRSVVKIEHEGKKITMTDSMAQQARLDPKMYPGCVEAGMEPIKEVFRNRNGRSKCITYHPFLSDCKCPLRGAALELWMIKMTAGIDGIPQRGDTDITNRRLALNPDILKVIASAIEVASGHDVEGLLQPEMDRLEGTVYWALGRLGDMAKNDKSKHAPSFALLAKKLKETMHHWMLEESDDDDES
ncbi:hypothetical protein K438DRAFT_1989995 [Mycena galopus ATCC 62051]|nr:hypothetical protein K438DRAFT_1989995 [Mycena galopus ATCC 62051]